MNLTRCANGHFYDADAFQFCPHCNAAGGVVQQPMGSGFAGGGSMMDSTMPYSDLEDSVFDTPTAPHTMPAQPETIPNNSLMDAVKEFQQGGDGGFEDEETDKTVRYQSLNAKQSPVVGWLVCISGEEIGRSFELKEGRNFIGRSDSQDVTLTGDKSISREKHAILVYDPKSRVFMVQPGESHELFYLNDEVVLGSTKLAINDKILIGNTKLIFVPFCGESFAWEDLDKAE